MEGTGNNQGCLAVNVPSARDGGVTGIMNPVVMNADKGAVENILS